MRKALRYIVIIDFSHYVQRKLLFWWFKSGVFEPHFGAYSRRERRYPYIKGCDSDASQKILWEQVVTCSAHSKKHFKTNLVEYWGGRVHGRSSYLPDYKYPGVTTIKAREKWRRFFLRISRTHWESLLKEESLKKKRIRLKICIMPCFVWLKSVLFNLLCVFDLYEVLFAYSGSTCLSTLGSNV